MSSDSLASMIAGNDLNTGALIGGATGFALGLLVTKGSPAGSMIKASEMGQFAIATGALTGLGGAAYPADTMEDRLINAGMVGGGTSLLVSALTLGGNTVVPMMLGITGAMLGGTITGALGMMRYSELHGIGATISSIKQGALTEAFQISLQKLSTDMKSVLGIAPPQIPFAKTARAAGIN